MANSPLILTLTLDHQSQHFFTEQRKRHFPPERNYLEAHLTLFHQLPPNEPQIITDIELATSAYKIIDLDVSAIKHTGNGVAYAISSPVLMQLHRYLQQLWGEWLIPQDKHTLWPHITVQNKVLPNEAALLKAGLEQGFVPFTAKGVGLSLYEYLGGPWRFVDQWSFDR